MILDPRRIEHATLLQEPFEWALIEEVIVESAFDALASNFPRTGFSLCSSAGEKSYQMYVRPIYDSRRSAPPLCGELHPQWKILVDELLSPKYRASVSLLTRRNLERHALEINFWSYGQGHWLAPHTDKAEKEVSQLFYFNSGWSSDWNGSLSILRSAAIEDQAALVPPLERRSVVLVRSERSWHAVMPQTAPEPIRRNVLQIIFWRPGSAVGRAYD